MPIYEYRCGACGHVFDALQKMSDEPLRDCPECGAPELKKALSAPRFRLKGGGWYETDFKTGDKKNLADGASVKDEKKDAKDDGAKKSSDKKTDAATSSKKETKPDKKSSGDAK